MKLGQRFDHGIIEDVRSFLISFRPLRCFFAFFWFAFNIIRIDSWDLACLFLAAQLNQILNTLIEELAVVSVGGLALLQRRHVI